MYLRKLLTVIGAIFIIAIASSIFSFESSANQTDSISTQQTSIEHEASSLQSAWNTASDGIEKFMGYSGFEHATIGHIVMIFIGLGFIFLAIRYDY
ncbi:MAG: hypothetical protein JW729_02955, partial [Bacteroidales bacterium]|nr:hypothetical protein [Bacteroidales bacterium]